MKINKLSIKAVSIAIILLLCSSCRVTQHRDFTVVDTARIEDMKNSNICIKTSRGRENFHIEFDEEYLHWRVEFWPYGMIGYTSGTLYILDKDTGKVKHTQAIRAL